MSMEYKGYIGSVEYSDEDEVLCGKVINIDALVSFEATTVKGLKKAFHDAVNDYLSFCKRQNRQPDRPLSGRITFRMGPEIHKQALILAAREGKSLNAVVKESVETYLAAHEA